MFSTGYPSETARRCAKAFLAGKKFEKNNCGTDGCTYWLYGNPIATRVPEKDVPLLVARKLRGEHVVTELQVTFARHPTKTTQAHLCAIIGDAYCGCSNTPPLIKGRKVESNEWYTMSQIEEMPKWDRDHDPKYAKKRYPYRERFVNVTLPLPFGVVHG